ncbi:MAG: AmmeMemoRadiSam system protein B [Burkholderiaceae bacterium]
MNATAPRIRPPAVAGTFYPQQPRVLARDVRAMLDGVRGVPAEPAPKLMIVPHAGYVYSGEVAARAYARLAPLAGRITRVVLFGPAHRVAVRGLALPGVDAFRTPLGVVPLDGPGVALAKSLPQVVVSDAAHAAEHSLEVQLPFLQTVLGGFTLVPLVVGHASPEDVARVIEALWGGDETLVLVSSDLSHYHAYDACRAIDHRTAAAILALEPRIDHEQACGATPINGALLCAARHGLSPRLVDLRNSGDTAGPRDRVVGYCSIAFEAGGARAASDASAADAASGAAPAASRDATGRDAAARDAAARDAADADALGRVLLRRARATIGSAFGFDPGRPADHPGLARHGATFVTLTQRGRLRGCIGTLQAHRPLGEDVRANALAAAFRDPRFEPLDVREYEQVRVEVSLLAPARPLPVRDEAHAREALVPHADGVILSWRGRRATFLPQVWESLPDPAEFLAQLKRKAGLPADFWAPDVVLERYAVLKWVEGGAGGAGGR